VPAPLFAKQPGRHTPHAPQAAARPVGCHTEPLATPFMCCHRGLEKLCTIYLFLTARSGSSSDHTTGPRTPSSSARMYDPYSQQFATIAQISQQQGMMPAQPTFVLPPQGFAPHHGGAPIAFVQPQQQHQQHQQHQQQHGGSFEEPSRTLYITGFPQVRLVSIGASWGGGGGA